VAADADRGKRLHALITGRVQGVGFRFFVQQAAAGAGATGWVRNRRDGRVEVVAEADALPMAQFTAALKRGAPSSFVSDVDLEWSPATGEFAGFEIRSTV